MLGVCLCLCVSCCIQIVDWWIHINKRTLQLNQWLNYYVCLFNVQYAMSMLPNRSNQKHKTTSKTFETVIKWIEPNVSTITL